MVEVPGHVADEGRVDDFEAGVVLAQTEHVASEVELLLPYVRHRLAYHLPDVLRHHCVLLGSPAEEQAQAVDLGGSDVDVVSGFFVDEVLFLPLDVGGLVEVLLDVFEGDEGNYLWLSQHFLALAALLEVEEVLLGDVVLILGGHVVHCGVEDEVTLALPLVPVVHLEHFSLALLPVERVEGQRLQEVREVVGLVVGAVSHPETHEFHYVLEASNGRVDFPEFLDDVIDAAHHCAALPEVQDPLLVPLLELDLQVVAPDLLEDPPAALGLCEYGGVALLEDYLVLFEDLECEVGEVLVEHFALVVDVDVVVLAVGRELVVLDEAGVFLEGVEVIEVALLGQQRPGALLLVDAVGQVLVVRVEPEVLLVLLGDGRELCAFRDPAGG